jgi:hypothetical protein
VDSSRFAAGDRVVFVPRAGRRLEGTIVERPLPGGRKSIIAGVGLVHVVLDGVSISIALPEKLLKHQRAD